MEKSCPYCEGRGWYWVQDGPDDCEKEKCNCKEEEVWV